MFNLPNNIKQKCGEEYDDCDYDSDCCPGLVCDFWDDTYETICQEDD